MIILEPLCIETVEGRKAYVIEQEALAGLAAPLRLRVIDAYDAALAQLATATAWCDVVSTLESHIVPSYSVFTRLTNLLHRHSGSIVFSDKISSKKKPVRWLIPVARFYSAS